MKKFVLFVIIIILLLSFSSCGENAGGELDTALPFADTTDNSSHLGAEDSTVSLDTEAPVTDLPKTEEPATELPATELPITEPPHVHQYIETITEPTCTEAGVAHYLCACGDEFYERRGMPKDHRYEASIIAPTCISEGYTTYTCFCGDSYVGDITAKTAHSYRQRRIEPTCTAVGMDIYTCICGDSFIGREISKTNHTWGKWETLSAGNCSTEEYSRIACTVCGICFEAYTGQRHSYNGDRTCTSCGKTYSKNLEFVSVDGGYGVKAGKNFDQVAIIPETYNGLPVVMIADQGFFSRYNYTELVLPDTVITIDMAALGYLKLGAFNFPNNLKDIGASAFTYCSLGAQITVPATVVRISAHPFDNCEALEEIRVEAENEHYYAEDGVLYSREGELIQYPTEKKDSAYAIPEGTEKIGLYAMANNSNLVSITFPSTLKTVENYAFSDAAALKEAILPQSLDILGIGAFYGCVSLERVYLPSGLKMITNSTFYGCSSLNTVTVGKDVKSIGKWSFRNCYSLVRIDYLGTVEEWNAIEKGEGWDMNTGAYTVYCSDGQISK